MMIANCNEGKHFWDMENGYCVGCAMTFTEYYNWKEPDNMKLYKLCECGAASTRNPEHHSRWCPQFKESK